MRLYEQYRPHSWSEVVGQDKALAKLERLRKRGGWGGRSFWISGASGTGKTSIARLLADELAETWPIVEMDGRKCTASKLAGIDDDVRSRPLGGGCLVWIINEAHLLPPGIIGQFLVTLEALPVWAVVIFTTTSEAQEQLFDARLDSAPFLSRCEIFALARRDLTQPFAERAKQIAQAEDLDGKPIEEYVKLMRKHHNNMRSALSDIEGGAMLGE